MEPKPLGNNGANAPRKVKFAPKAPPRRVQNSVAPKTEKIEIADDAAAQAQELLRCFNESVKVMPKVEKKLAPARVAFGYGGASTSLKSYGAPKGSIGINKGQGLNPDGGDYASRLREEKEYKEPWDYYSNYPVTLPLRRPYSGNPELLDEEEFGETSENMAYDEQSTKPAVELGLMEDNLEARMLFLQLPATLPMINKSTNTKVVEMGGSSKPPTGEGPKVKTCALNDLQAGFMGKMSVYKSGAIKLKLGDTLYDVSAGSDSVFAQDVAAINTEEKHCCTLGELSKRAIITPDVDSILNSMSDS